MTVEAIIISLAINLLAAIIWWSLFSLIGGKKKIAYLLTISRDTARQFETSVDYNDYDNACRQADRLIDLALSIESSIRPLTYLPRKKTLIRTYLYSSFRLAANFQCQNVGYSGMQEKEARCQAYKREYICPIEIESYTFTQLTLTYEVLLELNRVKFVNKALLEVPEYKLLSADKKQDLLINHLVYINAFKYNPVLNEDFIRHSVFTRDEYIEYITDKLRKGI